jgi:hypothetical protein
MSDFSVKVYKIQDILSIECADNIEVLKIVQHQFREVN